MKRLWMAFACLFVVLSLCVFEVVYTNNSVNEVYGFIQKAEEKFDGGQGDVKETEKLLDKAGKIWGERQSVLNIFLSHDGVEDVASKIDCATAFVKSENSEVMAQLAELMAILQAIKRAEIPTIDNIL